MFTMVEQSRDEECFYLDIRQVLAQHSSHFFFSRNQNKSESIKQNIKKQEFKKKTTKI